MDSQAAGGQGREVFFPAFDRRWQPCRPGRWPDKDGELYVHNVDQGVRQFSFNKQLPEKIASGNDAELVVYQNWAVTRGRIIDAGTQQVTTAGAMGRLGHRALTASRGKPAFVEHVRYFIDKPGEWFLDRRTGDLFYLARKGVDPDKAVIVAPKLEQIIKLTGTAGRPVKNLHFKRLSIKHTSFPLPPFGYNEIQAAHYGTVQDEKEFYVQPVAVECVYAESCRFDNCRFAHFGASGIGFGPGCKKNTVTHCQITDIGGNGIMVGWRGAGKLNPGRKEPAADWADPAMAPTGNAMTHCHIQRCGAESRGAVGIFAAFSADTRIAHNHVHDMPYTGISIGYRWNTTETSQVRCNVEYNHIHDVMQVLADGGGIYTLGYQPGTVLKGNHIHDIHRSPFAHGGASNNGFFFDQGSKGYIIRENVVYATSGRPIRFNKCRREWHRWHGNFFGEKKPADDTKARVIIRKAGPGNM